MIQKSDIRPGRKVLYKSTSNSRPWLKDAKLTLTGVTTSVSNSALVEYVTPNGDRGSDWIGFSALTLADNEHENTIKALNDQVSKLDLERKQLDAKINALNEVIKTLEEL